MTFKPAFAPLSVGTVMCVWSGQSQDPARLRHLDDSARPSMLLCDSCASPDAGRPLGLGLGRATYLLTYAKVHLTIRDICDICDICDQATTELGRESLWSV